MTRPAGPGEPDDDLYATLGVTGDATDADITSAYRRLARQLHPDTNPDAARHRFSGVTDAYDVLHDPVRRSAYDRTRGNRARAARSAQGVHIPIRGAVSRDQRVDGPRGRPGSIRSAPTEIELAISFDQAALGTTATVQLQFPHRCDSCGGTGRSQDGYVVCPACDARGFTVRSSRGINIQHQCPSCDGTGRRVAPPCPMCAGTGEILIEKDLTVAIPAGVDTGTRLRVQCPPDTGNVALPAVITVAPHPYFSRRGLDLTLTLPVTFAEAALGAVVTVPTLTGAIAIRIPPGTPHGRTLRARGRGIQGSPTPGDLLVTINIHVPTELDDAQRAALQAYAEATPAPRAFE
jgi:molecular chaperone DnaJ